MKKVTLRIPDELVDEIERWISQYDRDTKPFSQLLLGFIADGITFRHYNEIEIIVKNEHARLIKERTDYKTKVKKIINKKKDEVLSK